jgi:hypothetical protein
VLPDCGRPPRLPDRRLSRLGFGNVAGATVSVVEQTFGQRDRDQLRSRPRTGLGHGVAHVCADGVGRDVQRGADLGGDLAEGDATDDKRYVARRLFRILETTGPTPTPTSPRPRPRTIGVCS